MNDTQSSCCRVVLGLLLIVPVPPLVVWAMWIIGGTEGLWWAGFIAWVLFVFWLLD